MRRVDRRSERPFCSRSPSGVATEARTRHDAPMIAAIDARSFGADRVLRDGGSIHVRAIRPDDKQRLLDHFARLSARSVYFRFFRVKKHLTDDELRQFTELDFDRTVGLVATLRRD